MAGRIIFIYPVLYKRALIRIGQYNLDTNSFDVVEPLVATSAASLFARACGERLIQPVLQDILVASRNRKEVKPT